MCRNCDIFRPAIVANPVAFTRQQRRDATREARSRKVAEIVTLGLIIAFCMMALVALVAVTPVAALAISDWMAGL